MQPHNGFPKNPARHHMTNIPKAKGKVRGQGASLEYEDPVDSTWKSAVRLVDIRERIVKEAPPSLYTHKKECGHDPTDVTTFLAKDRTYGGQRQHRPPLLFQINPTGTHFEKPTKYLKDGDKIVLDAFDHGIRDFRGVLPTVLSSELAGHDIMYYFRQNEHIQLYDLIARQPNGYHEKDSKGLLTWHQGPPRYGTVGMRATRFRLQAGLLSWKKRMGSDARNAKILSFIPDNCKDPQVNSTQSFRDLTFQEQDEVSKVLLGSAPGRKRNFRKDDTDKKPQAKKIEDDSDAEDIIIRTDDAGLDQISAQVLPSQSHLTSEIHKNDNNDGPCEDKDSDSSSDESGKPPVKRQRAEGSLYEQYSLQKPFIDGSGLNIKFHPINSSDHHASTRHTAIEVSDDGVNSLDKDQDTSANKKKLDTEAQGEYEGDGKANNDEASEVSSEQSSKDQSQRPLAQEEADVILGNDPVNARLLNSAIINRQVTTAKPTMPVKSLPDTTGRDFRKVVPGEYPETVDDNIAEIQAALKLTRVDFRQRAGFDPPASLIKEHKDQSYVMQFHALQQQFAQSYSGPRPIPRLYLLPEWKGSYHNWKISDDRAQELYMDEK